MSDEIPDTERCPEPYPDGWYPDGPPTVRSEQMPAVEVELTEDDLVFDVEV